jgi:histidyl-tRNA synthetase
MKAYLNAESQQFFDNVLKCLDDSGIEYVLDNNLVRGLDYYNHTVYEIISNVEGFGAQTALGGGGRYNGLVQVIGGPDIPGVGFAFGMDRLILALEAENITIPESENVDVYLVTMSDKTNQFAMKILDILRKSQIKCDKDYFDRKVKAQFKQADKVKAKYVIIIGEEEMKQNKVSIKNMKNEVQETIEVKELVKELTERLEVYYESNS